jgi:UDP-glucose 4-epimerase
VGNLGISQKFSFFTNHFIIKYVKNVLVTGGAGYIGSHTTLVLLDSGFEPIIVDSFSNSSPEVIKRLEKIAGREIKFHKVDLCDKEALAGVFDKYNFDAVIHFAGYKAVGESMAKPIMYYRNNLLSTINLCELMQEHNVGSLAFSSSATVYGDPEKIPVPESAPIHPTNPYGQTKAMIEQILQDWTTANKNISVSLLRYFNPIGAHPSGLN